MTSVTLGLVVVCACAGTALGGDAGVRSHADGGAVAVKEHARNAGSKTTTFAYEDASGTQTLVVSFLPKRRLALKITRERKDGCRWSKELTARSVGVQDYSLPDGDTTDVDEYEIEPKQMDCPMFLDIEKESMAFADITTTRCASLCKLSGDAVMRPKGQ